MHYIPNLDRKKEMLEGMGLKSVDDLFADVPQDFRIDKLNIPDGMTEMELMALAMQRAGQNMDATKASCFLGAGIYRHHIPEAVRSVMRMPELYTAYTPYQAEMSQGMLQALWEYQSYIAELTGHEYTNSSMYDQATALGEAARLVVRATHKNEFIIPKAIHWGRKDVLNNYVRGVGIKIKEVPFDTSTGTIDMTVLKETVGPDTAGVYVENPNLFGIWETAVTEMKAMVGDALLVVGAGPLSLAIAKPPADYGADVVIGEGQALGIPMAMGGPSFGFLSTSKKYLRQMPGRVIGMTKDANGDRAFCLTLQTREQHIRREKATSNICSNEALCAVMAASYMAYMGKSYADLAKVCASKARRLARGLSRIKGLKAPLFNVPYFNEFVVGFGPMNDKSFTKGMREKGIFAGIRLDQYFPEMGHALLVATTEMNSEEDIKRYITIAEDVLNSVNKKGKGGA